MWAKWHFRIGRLAILFVIILVLIVCAMYECDTHPRINCDGGKRLDRETLQCIPVKGVIAPDLVTDAVVEPCFVPAPRLLIALFSTAAIIALLFAAWIASCYTLTSQHYRETDDDVLFKQELAMKGHCVTWA